MELIERYLQAVGRALPSAQRDDILAELRSSLRDALDADEADEPAEETVVALLKQMGAPQKVAASYYPSNQYLIGPSLYPIFQMVLGIVFTMIIGVQLLAVVASFAAHPMPNLWREFWGITDSLPAALGAVVVVFWLLQHAEVQINRQETFDPRRLPALAMPSDAVSRGEQVFGIVINVSVLVALARFAEQGGFSWVDGSGFFENPVIERYFPWLCGAMVAWIVLDIILLWRGRWQVSTRIATIVVNLLGLFVLAVLIRGHTVWLTAAGVPNLFSGLDNLANQVIDNSQIAGMLLVQGILVFAALATVIETLLCGYRLLRSRLRPTRVPPTGLISA